MADIFPVVYCIFAHARNARNSSLSSLISGSPSSLKSVWGFMMGGGSTGAAGAVLMIGDTRWLVNSAGTIAAPFTCTIFCAGSPDSESLASLLVDRLRLKGNI